jgi:hypothetical protein
MRNHLKNRALFASKIISLSNSIPLLERISKVKNQISQWQRSLERPFNDQTDMLRLLTYEKNGREYIYIYKYKIVRRAR